MRIAQIVASYQPRLGGVETHVSRIARGCAEAGDQITVLTHEVAGSPRNEWLDGVRIRRFPLTFNSTNYAISLSLFHYLSTREKHFDLVHAHSYHTLMGHAAMRGGVPYVYTPHYHGTGHSPFREVLHRAYKPLGEIGRASCR